VGSQRRRDARRTVEYIARDSPAAARQLAANVVAAAESLADLSERGRTVPELNDARYRELLVSSYRLVYRVSEDTVGIVAVVHGARDFRSWWKRFRADRSPN
jgi:plasmid stabilization system protein ParE